MYAYIHIYMHICVCACACARARARARARVQNFMGFTVMSYLFYWSLSYCHKCSGGRTFFLGYDYIYY